MVGSRLLVMLVALAAPALAEDATRATAIRRQVGDAQVLARRDGAVEVQMAGGRKVAGRLTAEEKAALGAALKALDVDALQRRLAALPPDDAAPEVTLELVGLSEWNDTFVLPPSARAVRAGFAALERLLDQVVVRVVAEAPARIERRGRVVPHEGGLALEADGAKVVLAGETAGMLQRLGESAWKDVSVTGQLERRAAGVERLVLERARCTNVTVSGTLARASNGYLHLGNGVALGRPADDRRMAWFDGLVGHPLRVEGDLEVRNQAALFLPGFRQLDRREQELDWTTGVRDGKPRLLDPSGWPYEATGPAAAFLNQLAPGTKVRLRAIRWERQVIVSRVLATLAAPVDVGADWQPHVVPAGAQVGVIEVVGDEALVSVAGVKDAKKVPVEALRLGSGAEPRDGLTDRITSAIR